MKMMKKCWYIQNTYLLLRQNKRYKKKLQKQFLTIQHCELKTYF